jgi:hypothetical protein
MACSLRSFHVTIEPLWGGDNVQAHFLVAVGECFVCRARVGANSRLTAPLPPQRNRRAYVRSGNADALHRTAVAADKAGKADAIGAHFLGYYLNWVWR